MNIDIALCQTDAKWGDAAYNLPRLELIVAQAAAEVVVLPELFATGFNTENPDQIAQTMEGPTVRTMRAWAEGYGKAIVGSLAITERGHIFNRQLFVTPAGQVSCYDKRHLFSPGGEAQYYTPGVERVVVNYKGFRFLLLTCYDLRFPVWCRNRNDYDVVLCCASWAAARSDVWQVLLRARAIENQCYVVGVNRTGSDQQICYAGDSAAIDFKGETLVVAAAGQGSCVAQLDLVKLQNFRAQFPAWCDADDFNINI